jgi:hypothetical protein
MPGHEDATMPRKQKHPSEAELFERFLNLDPDGRSRFMARIAVWLHGRPLTGAVIFRDLCGTLELAAKEEQRVFWQHVMADSKMGRAIEKTLSVVQAWMKGRNAPKRKHGRYPVIHQLIQEWPGLTGHVWKGGKQDWRRMREALKKCNPDWLVVKKGTKDERDCTAKALENGYKAWLASQSSHQR